MYRVNHEMMTLLLHAPESGMGYQLVGVGTTGYEPSDGVVLGARLLLLDSDREADQHLLRTKSLAALAMSAPAAPENLRILIPPNNRQSRVAESKSSGAALAPVETTGFGERFPRFSAFEDDLRVAADRSLRPGSYATTEEDGLLVETGADAVERSALPNDDPASYRFKIRPHSRTAIQRGIVQPAFGHRGGGVEVIFPEGTQPATVMVPPDRLPDR